MPDFTSKLDSIEASRDSAPTGKFAAKIDSIAAAEGRVVTPAEPEGASSTFAERLDAAGDFIGDNIENALKASKTMAGGFMEAASTFYDALDGWSKFISEKTGLARSGVFGKLADYGNNIADRLTAEGINPEDGFVSALAYHLNAGVGSAGFDLPAMMAFGLPTYSAITGGGQVAGQEGATTGQVVRATGESLAHGMLVHKVFKELAPFSRGVQMSSGALVMGGETMIRELEKPVEERDFSRVIAETIVGAGLAAGGKGNVTFREGVDNLYRQYRVDLNRAAEKLNIDTREMQYVRAVEIAKKVTAEKATLEEAIAGYEAELKKIPGMAKQLEAQAPEDLYKKHQAAATAGKFDIEFTGKGTEAPSQALMEKARMAVAFVEARYPSLVKLSVRGYQDAYTDPLGVVHKGYAFPIRFVSRQEFMTRLGTDQPTGLHHKNYIRHPKVAGQEVVTSEVFVKLDKGFWTLSEKRKGIERYPEIDDLVNTLVHELTHRSQTFKWPIYKLMMTQGGYPGSEPPFKLSDSVVKGGEVSHQELMAMRTGYGARQRYIKELNTELSRLRADLDAMKADVETKLEAAKLEYKVKFSTSSAKEQAKLLAAEGVHMSAIHPGDDVVWQLAGDIRYSRPKGDILSFTHLYRSLESMLRDQPEAQKIAGDIIEAQQRAHHKIYTVDEAFFQALEGRVPKGRRKDLRKAVDELYKLRTTNPDRGQELIDTDPLYQSANDVIRYFENMRNVVIEYKKKMFQHQVTKDMYDAFIDATNAPEEQIESIAKSYNVDPDALKVIYKEYKSIEKWGINDFVTNIEVGSYRVLDSKGVVRAVAQTRAEATAKAKKLQQLTPAIGQLTVSSEFKAPVDPTKPRKDILLGEEDIMKALRTYSRAIHQRIEYDQVEAAMDKAFEADRGSILYTKNVRKALKQQMQDTRFVHSWGDEVLDRLQKGFDIGGKHFKGMGGRPLTYTRATGAISNVWANLKLGYRPVAAAINFISGHGHTWVKNSAGEMVDAIKFMRTTEGKKFLVDEEPYLGLDFAASESGKLHSKTPWWKPTGLFGMPEPGIRKLSIATNYLHAKNKLGMSEEAARQFARRSVRLQNFTYNTAALPRLLRTPTGKVVGQFKTYLVKELEFLQALSGPEWGRYLTMQMLIGGPRAMLQTLRSVPLLGLLGAWDKIDEWLLKDKSGMSSGLPGFVAGADVSAAASFQVLPDKAVDTAGPFLSDMVKTYTQMFKPIVGGQRIDIRSAGDWMKGLAPVMRHWDALLQSAVGVDENGQVWIRESAYPRGITTPPFAAVGKRKYLVNGNWDRALMIAGASTLPKARVQVADRLMNKASKIDNDNRKRTSKAFLDAIQANVQPSKSVLDEMAVLMMDTNTVEQAMKVREMTPQVRAVFYNNTVMKLKALELYDE